MNEENQTPQNRASLVVSDLNGIDDTEVDIKSGLTTLSGHNATNRTSLLRAITDVLGGTKSTVRRGASDGTGTVQLKTGDKAYTRSLTQHEGYVARDGEPCTANEAIVDLFVSIVEDNEIRQLIETGDRERLDAELADLLMAPVNVEEIKATIDDLQTRETELEKKLDEVATAKNQLPELQSRHEEIKGEISEVGQTIQRKREKISDLNIDQEQVDKANEHLGELESVQEEFQEVKQTISRKRRNLESEEERLDEIETEIDRVETQLEDTTAPDASELGAIRERRKELQSATTILGNLAEANRSLLTFDELDIPPLEKNDTSAHVTEELLTESTDITCPTCGCDVERDRIEEHLSHIRQTAASYREELEEVENRAEELRNKRNEIEQLESERTDLLKERKRLERRIEEKKSRIESLRERREQLQEQLATLRERVEDAKQQRHQELEDLYKEIADHQREQADLQSKLSHIEDEIADCKSMIDEEADLKDTLSKTQASITTPS